MDKEYLQQFIDYIKNTGGSPLIVWFDEDWEPIGPTVRKVLEREGIISYLNGKILLKGE